MGIHGLLPPAVFSQDVQIERVLANFRQCSTDLDKYIYLSSLQDRNIKLFYAVVTKHVEEMAPIIYTPTVGLACQRFGAIFRRPRYGAAPDFSISLVFLVSIFISVIKSLMLYFTRSASVPGVELRE
jgi:malic enzyme